MYNSFFHMLLRLAIIHDSHHLENCLKFVSPKTFQHPLSAHVTSRLRESLLVVFLEHFLRKHGFLGRFFVSGMEFLYLTPRCQLLEFYCSETAFAKQWLVYLDFSDDIFFLS